MAAAMAVTLNQKLTGVAEEQPVGDAVERLVREHTRQQRANGAADAVRGNHVERIVERRLGAPHQHEVAGDRGDRRRARSRSSG